jgi:D-3-phosphoglycerate dehydrogenase / 2-oxoglutarate reductase
VTTLGPHPQVVLIGCAIPTDLALERRVLAQAGAELIDLRGRTVASAIDQLRVADAVLTEGIDRLGHSVLSEMPVAKVISLTAVGTDGVDVAAATEHGIAVTNVADFCSQEVADHTVMLVLAALRKLREAERLARSGDWRLDTLRPIRRLQGRVCGLLGFGRIARNVAMRLHGFGVTIIAHDPDAATGECDGLPIEFVDLEQLLARSEILSLHAPLTPGTARVIGESALAALPRGALLVNAGRGGLIDHDSLLAALDSGQLGGAALDVFETEPAPPQHPLLTHPGVICTPHMAYYSDEALAELRTKAARNVVDVLAGVPSAALVNPEVFAYHRRSTSFMQALRAPTQTRGADPD